MTLSPTSRVFSKTSPSRLGTYLATAIGSCGLASSADADIVTIDVANISGVNGGVAAGSEEVLSKWVLDGTLGVSNSFVPTGSSVTITGLRGLAFLNFASSGYATPTNYSYGSSISSGSTFGDNSGSLFRVNAGVSPAFGPNSYMGFRLGLPSSYNYGWIEVTWDGTNFEIKSAAYESTLNAPILAGAAAPVPEPSTGALAALVLGGTALGVARRRRKQEAAATSEQAV